MTTASSSKHIGFYAAAAALLLAHAALPAKAQSAPRPAALQAIEQHGITVVGSFPAAGGLQGHIDQYNYLIKIFASLTMKIMKRY